jgi:hypothetical protein
MALLGAVVALALVGAAVVAIRDGGSSEAEDRIGSFNAAMMTRQLSFTYELDVITENVTSVEAEDVVPGGPVEVVQIDGTVAAEDRFAMRATGSEGVDEVVRVGGDLFQRHAEDDEWRRTDYEAPEPPSLSEVRLSLEPGGDLDESEARIRTIAAIYLNTAVLDPAHLPAELADVDPRPRPEGSEPDVADEVAEAFDDDVAAVGWVPFPDAYESVLPEVPPMVVRLQLDPDGHPRSAQLEIRDDDKAVIADLRFADWGSDLEVVAPEGAKEAKEVFEEVGEAIEDDPSIGGSVDQPGGTKGSSDGPPALDPAMAVWMPTAVPDDFQLADLVAADESGDDSCRGVFAIWMASGRPAAPWVTQDTPDEDNSQLLTVRSVPADCAFVERAPLFGPGPFGDRPARRIGDQWEVLIDDIWVVRFDSVVVTWDELVAMVDSLDTVPVQSLEAQLP